MSGVPDDLADQQRQRDTAAGRLLEAFRRRNPRSVAGAHATGRIELQLAHLGVDHGLRQLDRIRREQAVQDLLLDARLDRLAQLALHVFLHFRAQTLDAAFLHAVGLGEFVVQLGQLALFDLCTVTANLACLPARLAA